MAGEEFRDKEEAGVVRRSVQAVDGEKVPTGLEFADVAGEIDVLEGTLTGGLVLHADVVEVNGLIPVPDAPDELHAS